MGCTHTWGNIQRTECSGGNGMQMVTETVAFCECGLIRVMRSYHDGVEMIDIQPDGQMEPYVRKVEKSE